MPTTEIKALRQAGKLSEAYELAISELNAAPDNIWAKRNISWVLYAQLNDFAGGNFSDFIAKIEEVQKLNLPDSEDMFWGNIAIPIAKIVRFLTNQNDANKIFSVFQAIKDFPLIKLPTGTLLCSKPFTKD
jgi:hypothetical protein